MSILYHFSEEPDIRRFEPRVSASQRSQEAVVWAMNAERSPLYFFPRDCPRVAFWALPETTDADRFRYLTTSAKMVIAVEGAWLERIRETRLYRYVLSGASFRPSQSEGFYGGYISPVGVTPVCVEPVGDLMTALRDAKVELRVTPSLLPLKDTLVNSTLHFSMIRMRNSARPDNNQ